MANDLEQATSRVFQAIKRIVECSPLLRREAKITADKITFPAFADATITAIASDYAGAAGANPTISSSTSCGDSQASARTDFGTR